MGCGLHKTRATKLTSFTAEHLPLFEKQASFVNSPQAISTRREAVQEIKIEELPPNASLNEVSQPDPISEQPARPVTPEFESKVERLPPLKPRTYTNVAQQFLDAIELSDNEELPARGRASRVRTHKVAMLDRLYEDLQDESAEFD